MLDLNRRCGVSRFSTNILKCTRYQKSIIESYLSTILKKNITVSLRRANKSNFLRFHHEKPDYIENLSNLDLDSKYNNQKSVNSSHMEYHHRLKDESSNFFLDIILMENDITSIETECILSPIVLNSSSSILDKIKYKAGNVYKVQLEKCVEDYVKSKNESKKV